MTADQHHGDPLTLRQGGQSTGQSGLDPRLGAAAGARPYQPESPKSCPAPTDAEQIRDRVAYLFEPIEMRPRPRGSFSAALRPAGGADSGP